MSEIYGEYIKRKLSSIINKFRIYINVYNFATALFLILVFVHR